MEQICNDRLIANEVIVPCLECGFMLRLIWFLLDFNIGFLAFAVQVLTHQIKNRVNAFVGVVLPEACKGWGVLAKDTLEHRRSYCSVFHIPHLVEQFGVSHHETALCTKDILDR